ncbi:hypothetical protein [Streptomyces sp. DSM 40484]|uniref:hypothetical protein n=1 Tax=Streptomyces kroppenstedtii TaxID=3051181 RepID=UPI0028D47C0A|nr:hypothetical protein [Streptomyces sp. DSM 40484]
MSAPEDQDEAEVWPEDVPDGSFGHARHTRPLIHLPANFVPCSREEQARHVAQLTDELEQFAVGPAIRRLLEENIVTSDRHLALMALMAKIQGSVTAYRHAVRQASAVPSNSDAYDTAVARGNGALDDIEQAIRLWITAHPEKPTPDSPDTLASADSDRAAIERAHALARQWGMLRAYGGAATELRRALAGPGPHLPAGFVRTSVVTVSCACCQYTHDEDESYTVMYESVEEATQAVKDAGWTVLDDGRVLCDSEDSEHQDLRDAQLRSLQTQVGEGQQTIPEVTVPQTATSEAGSL